MQFLLVSLLAVATALGVQSAEKGFNCNDASYKTRTCCKNQMVHIDEYKGDFLAYVCAYNRYAFIDPDGGWYCTSNAVSICCNEKDGYIAPLGDGRQHSEPNDFRCQGLSGQDEDVFAVV